MDRRITLFAANLTLLFLVVSGVQTVFASPKYRLKRTSDMHLNDLESRIALGERVDKMVLTLPVGLGRTDPRRIGRKRRSEARFFDVLFNHSDEDNVDSLSYDTFLERVRHLKDLN